MKNYIFLFLLTSMFVVNSCTFPPELPSTPKISLKKIEFKNIADLPDSLIVTISFEDAEGDLGFRDRDEKDSVFQEFYIAKGANGLPIKYGSSSDLPPYNCVDYDTVRVASNGTLRIDTVLIKRNEFYHNYHITFFRKKAGSQDYEEFDFHRMTCISMKGRFANLNSEDYERPLEGNLKYGMQSYFFWSEFYSDSLQIKVYIYDRDRHKSNEVVSEPFTLKDILVK